MSEASRTPVLLKGGARTPIGRFLGGLSRFSAPELGAIAIRAAVERSGIDVTDVEDVIMGQRGHGGRWSGSCPPGGDSRRNPRDRPGYDHQQGSVAPA